MKQRVFKPQHGQTFQIERRITSTPQNAYSPPHVHAYVEILYCFHGSYHVFLDDCENHFGAGDMVVINSRQIHESYPEDVLEGDYLVVKFQPEMIYACYSSAAEHCYMEYSYFSRTFKQITKKSCTEYINHFRIQKAEALLLSTKLSITDISEKVGFDNVSYFIKQFCRYKGISPKQYQNRLLNRLRDNPL